MTFSLTGNKICFGFYLIRILLVFAPQTGYIHPDEIFQSLEVFAGRIFDVQYSPPWEFELNVTNPIRSVSIPYMTVGFSYILLKNLNDFSKHFFNLPLMTPYILLVVPRLLMCMFSFVVDYCLYKLCQINDEKYKSRLIILSSSYVMIVFGTRTFSNIIELMLFSLLLFLVCESFICNKMSLSEKRCINFHYNQSKIALDKSEIQNLHRHLASDSYRHCFVIGTITVFGFFYRPTFAAYAVTPIFYWLYRGVGSRFVSSNVFYFRLLVLGMVSIPSILVNILVDSFYYGRLTWQDIKTFDVSIKNFVFTTLNFVRYNGNLDILAQHGLHPWYLHTLVNIPLLFNVLGIYGVYMAGKHLYFLCCSRKFNIIPIISSTKCMMTMSFVISLALISICPHQEPRYIMAVVFPLVFLHAMAILPERDQKLLQSFQTSSVVQPKKKNSRVMFKIWLVANVILTCFYGFFHQGSVYQATAYLSNHLQGVPNTTEYHILTSHIYSIPESFFLQHSKHQPYLKGQISESESNKRLFLYEEGSKDISSILEKLESLLGSRKIITKERKIYLLISGSLEDNLYYESQETYLKLDRIKRFSPHLSVEAFPDFSVYCLDTMKPLFNNNCVPLPLENYIKWLMNLFTLHLYSVELKS